MKMNITEETMKLAGIQSEYVCPSGAVKQLEESKEKDIQKETIMVLNNGLKSVKRAKEDELSDVIRKIRYELFELQ